MGLITGEAEPAAVPGTRASATAGGSQGESAYQRLLDAIRRGTLQPGARLIETDLARHLGVSRTPIREAIRQLEADGLVVHLPRLGAAVRSLDYAEVMELYEMRAVLESTAARLAARAASEVEIAELAALNAEMAQAGEDPVPSTASTGSSISPCSTRPRTAFSRGRWQPCRRRC